MEQAMFTKLYAWNDSSTRPLLRSALRGAVCNAPEREETF